MTELAKTSRIVATDLRRAERSINLATRDTAQLLLTTLDATESHRLSPAIAHPTVEATIGALAALSQSQGHIALRAHRNATAVGRALGLSAADWGEGAPKPDDLVGAVIAETVEG